MERFLSFPFQWLAKLAENDLHMPSCRYNIQLMDLVLFEHLQFHCSPLTISHSHRKWPPHMSWPIFCWLMVFCLNSCSAFHCNCGDPSLQRFSIFRTSLHLSKISFLCYHLSFSPPSKFNIQRRQGGGLSLLATNSSRCILRLFRHPWQYFLTLVLSIALLKYFNPSIPFGKETQKNHVKNFAFCQNSLDPHPYTPLALTVKIHHSLCAQASLWKWAPKNAKFKILWKIWKMRQWWGTKNVYSKVTQKFHSIG